MSQKYSALERLIAGAEGPIDKKCIGKPYGLALSEGALYVCDVQQKLVHVLDVKAKTFTCLPKEAPMVNPVNLCIEDGRKYVADPVGGQVFVFDRGNALVTTLGKDLQLQPIDVAVQGGRCYVADMSSNQIVVIDIASGREILRIGRAGDGDGQFGLIGGIAVDGQANVYATDKALGRVMKFDRAGVFQKTFGKVGNSIHDFVRPKGIDIDRDGRMWIVDAASEVVKTCDSAGQLLMFFGLPGREPGSMNLPASIALDYENVALFREHFTAGAQIEFLVLVSNQYGTKINVYGFGTFPLQEEALREAAARNEAGSGPQAATQKESG